MKFRKNVTIINGCKTFYWERSRGQKNALVLLHGFPGNHRVVMDMAKNLGDFRIIIPDLPACGQSDSLKEKHVLANYAEWFDNFLNNVSVNQPIIVGYSFGTRVAVTFAEKNPKKIKKMALITPVVKPDSLIARLACLEYEIADKLPYFIQETWLKNKVYHGISNIIIFKSASKKRRQYLIDNDSKEVKRLDPRANVELFKEFLSSRPISKGSKIDVETLLIAADKDEIATPNSVKELAERFINPKLEIIKDSGHIVIAERPVKTASVIKRWLS